MSMIEYRHCHGCSVLYCIVITLHQCNLYFRGIGLDGQKEHIKKCHLPKMIRSWKQFAFVWMERRKYCHPLYSVTTKSNRSLFLTLREPSVKRKVLGALILAGPTRYNPVLDP